MPNTPDYDKYCPPPFPKDAVYTTCYCEENIYLLAKQFLDDEEIRGRWNVYAVFISNPTRSVALWKQKLRENVVIWDYHVILVLEHRFKDDDGNSDREDIARLQSVWVYDFDSTLETPCTWSEYVAQTFPYSAMDATWTISDNYRSLFRIVPGQDYLELFASDRSHMIDKTFVQEHDKPIKYISPPPSYAAIVGSKAKENGVYDNLMASFVDMNLENKGVGVVSTLEDANRKFAGTCIY